MEVGCEHTEGSPIGKCAICDRTVCSECYRDLFAAMICDLHEELEDESDWVLVGFYGDAVLLADRRYMLAESGVSSLQAEGDEDIIELYVPTDDKDDAFASLSLATEDSLVCTECKIQYTTDLEACPICGVRSERPRGGADQAL